MGWFGNKVAKIKHDPNLTRAVRGVKYASKELRAGTGNWMLKKVPIVQWLPAYMPKWIAGDAIAGISVGLLLVPQAVTYSALAGVPIQTALLSSWLPGMIYAITGTSKGMAIQSIPFLNLSYELIENIRYQPRSHSNDGSPC
jgi:sodium-independent sulfate anion transporter 11